jgi:hypothetical protein
VEGFFYVWQKIIDQKNLQLYRRDGKYHPYKFFAIF